MNINKNTKDFIPGASYFRRDKDGNPTGFLAEPHALLSKVSDSYKIDKDRIYKSLKQLNSTYNSLGYRSIVDAGFILISNEDGLKILKKMEDNNELTMHYYPTYYWIGHSFEPISETEKNMIRLNKNYSSDLIKPDTLKMFADGVIETKTALLRENYPGTDKKGSIMNSEEAILISKLALDEAKEQYRQVSGRYKAGVGDIIELKDGETTYLNARLDFYNALLNYNTNAANLEREIGVPLSTSNENVLNNINSEMD